MNKTLQKLKLIDDDNETLINFPSLESQYWNFITSQKAILYFSKRNSRNEIILDSINILIPDEEWEKIKEYRISNDYFEFINKQDERSKIRLLKIREDLIKEM